MAQTRMARNTRAASNTRIFAHGEKVSRAEICNCRGVFCELHV